MCIIHKWWSLSLICVTFIYMISRLSTWYYIAVSGLILGEDWLSLFVLICCLKLFIQEWGPLKFPLPCLYVYWFYYCLVLFRQLPWLWYHGCIFLQFVAISIDFLSQSFCPSSGWLTYTSLSPIKTGFYSFVCFIFLIES